MIRCGQGGLPIPLPARSSLAYLALVLAGDGLLLALLGWLGASPAPPLVGALALLACVRTAGLHLATTHSLATPGGSLRAPLRALVASQIGALGALALSLLPSAAAVAALDLPLAAAAGIAHFFVLSGPLLLDARRGGEEPPAVRIRVRTLLLLALSASLAVLLATTVGLAYLPGIAADPARLREAQLLGGIVAGLAGLALATFAGSLVAQDVLLQARRAQALAEGDLRTTAPSPIALELGSLGEALNDVGRRLTAAEHPLGGERDGARAEIAAIARMQREALAQSRSRAGALEGIETAAGSLERRVHDAEQATERAAEAVLRAEAALSDLCKHARHERSDAENLARGGDGAGRLLALLGESLRRAHGVAAGLSTDAGEAVSGARVLDETVARATSGLSENTQLAGVVATEAEKGYRAVHQTLDQIERIRDLAGHAHHSISALSVRAQGIGHIVSVIEEIAEKTNLLALNASIIAAQAGQYGRGFAVVASEIKALAQRTAQSTKEIGQQIRGVQEESASAATAMSAGVEAVQQGFQVAVGAGDALGEIRQSARAAQRKLQSVGRAIGTQGEASARMSEIIDRLNARATELAGLLHDQSSAGDRAQRAITELTAASTRIQGSLSEIGPLEQRSSEAIAETVESCSLVHRAHKDARQQVERILDQEGILRSASAATNEQLVEAVAAIETLQVALDREQSTASRPDSDDGDRPASSLRPPIDSPSETSAALVHAATER